MIGPLARAALVCTVVLVARAPAAGRCPMVGEGAAGPLPGGTTRGADFGAIPEACPATEVALRARGIMIRAAGAPDYYRSFDGSLMVRLRQSMGDRTWVSLAFDAADYTYVENWGLGASQFSIGPPTVGFYRTVFAGDTTSAAVYGRALLPLETSRHVGFRTGLEIGGAFRAVPGWGWAVDGGAALTAPTDLVAGQVHGQLIPVGLVEGWRAIRPALAVGLGAALKAELAPSPSLLSATPRLSIRLALSRFWLAALVEAPILGQFLGVDDRTDVVGGLFAGYNP